VSERDAFSSMLDAAEPTDEERAADLAAVRSSGRRRPGGKLAVAAAAAAAIAVFVFRAPVAPPDARLWLRVADLPAQLPASLSFSHARSSDVPRVPTIVMASLSSTLVSCALAATDPDIALDLKDAEAGQVMRLLAGFEERDVIAPTCAAERRVDMRLDNAPSSAAWALLAAELDLTLHRTPNTIYVQCGGPPALARELADRRVSLSVSWTPTSDALESLAEAAGLAGSRLEGPEQGATLSLTDVRLETVLAAAAESFKLGELYVEDGVLVGRVVTPLTPERPPDDVTDVALERLLSTALECRADPEDRASATVVLDAEGRVVWAELTDVQAKTEETAACVREAVATMVVTGGEAVGLASLDLPLAGHPPGGGDDASPRADLVQSHVDAEGAGVSCDGSTCLVEVVLPDNNAVADLLSRLDAADIGSVYLVHIAQGPRGGRQARIQIDETPEP